MNDYPVWVCSDCGWNAQPDKSQVFLVSTYHTGTCGVCKKKKAVTEPRDFGYPTFPEEDV